MERTFMQNGLWRGKWKYSYFLLSLGLPEQARIVIAVLRDQIGYTGILSVHWITYWCCDVLLFWCPFSGAQSPQDLQQSVWGGGRRVQLHPDLWHCQHWAVHTDVRLDQERHWPAFTDTQHSDSDGWHQQWCVLQMSGVCWWGDDVLRIQ